MHVMKTETWDKLVAALDAIQPDFWNGDRENQIKHVLCEVGDIVPAAILDDIVGDEG